MQSLPHSHDKNIKKVLENMPGDENFSNAALIFQQLDDPTRLKILWILCHSRECVSDIAAALGVSKAVVSHHLQLLRRSNLVTGTRAGQEIHYSLNATKEAELIHKTIDAIFQIACPSENS